MCEMKSFKISQLRSMYLYIPVIQHGPYLNLVLHIYFRGLWFSFLNWVKVVMCLTPTKNYIHFADVSRSYIYCAINSRLFSFYATNISMLYIDSNNQMFENITYMDLNLEEKNIM